MAKEQIKQSVLRRNALDQMRKRLRRNRDDDDEDDPPGPGRGPGRGAESSWQPIQIDDAEPETTYNSATQEPETITGAIEEAETITGAGTTNLASNVMSTIGWAAQNAALITAGIL
jgi:hypothetical protein